MLDRKKEKMAPGTGAASGTLVHRQSAWTRITHWMWAVSLGFLLLSGLQIFNAHPVLYIGDQSGFQFENHVLAIGAESTDAGPRGYTEILGAKFDTSGVLGMSGRVERPRYVAFPSWATIPSHRDLGAGRVVHFFFAWMLVGTLLVWLFASAINGHFRELVPAVADIKRLPSDIGDHARLRFHHTRDYNTLQKLTYAVVLFVFFPLMILTGLAMSPSIERAAAHCSRTVRRPPDGAHHPFRHHGAARAVLRRPYRDDPCRRPDQRIALDHHRLVPDRSAQRGQRPTERSV